MAEKQHIKLGVVVFDELSVEAYFNSGDSDPQDPRIQQMAELFRETIKSSFEGRRVVWIDAEDIPEDDG